MPSKSFQLKILKKECLPAQTVYFVLGPDDASTELKPQLPSYASGAHIPILLPSGRRRNYSLLGNGRDLSTYEIAVKRLENGQGGSKELIDTFEVGDVMTIQEPVNFFPLVKANTYLFIAGGIGITPIISFLKELLSSGNAQFRVIYCTRTSEEILFKEWLDANIPADCITYHHDDGQAENRFDFWSLLGEPTDAVIYCCGPKAMMEDVQAMTGHWDEGSIHFEDFGNSATIASPSYSTNQAFYVKRQCSGEEFLVKENETILEALRKNGFEIPSSCESGTCGTCKTAYLEGEVEHRDLVLSADERTRNILICVSRAKSSSLLLDW